MLLIFYAILAINIINIKKYIKTKNVKLIIFFLLLDNNGGIEVDRDPHRKPNEESCMRPVLVEQWRTLLVHKKATS